MAEVDRGTVGSDVDGNKPLIVDSVWDMETVVKAVTDVDEI